MPLCTSPTSESFSGTIPWRRPPSIAIGSCEVFPSAIRLWTAGVLSSTSRGHASAVLLLDQHLCDHAVEIVREGELHLPAVLGGIEIDDAIDRARGSVRREAGDHQMARRCGLE